MCWLAQKMVINNKFPSQIYFPQENTSIKDITTRNLLLGKKKKKNLPPFSKLAINNYQVLWTFHHLLYVINFSELRECGNLTTVMFFNTKQINFVSQCQNDVVNTPIGHNASSMPILWCHYKWKHQNTTTKEELQK